MNSLQEGLQSAGYRATEELVYQVLAALNTRPCAGCFLTGPAGSGKTFLAEAVARTQRRETFFFQAFPGCRKEELFQTILPDASQPSGFRTQAGVLPLAADASRKGITALILDEWDKTHPSTDAFLLDFLQNGRVSLPGTQIQAEQGHLVVFITLNDERELSEPLLRRLPLIELRQPPAALVESALRDTHGEHTYLPAAVALYQRSLLVSLEKPVTIQELRQLLSAITELGPRADWNRLVFQFVTKNWDDHELLKSAESLPLSEGLSALGRERPVLDAGRYVPSNAQAAGGLSDPAMPRIHRDWLNNMPSRAVAPEAARVYGVVPRSESGYDGVARALLHRKPNPGLPSDPADLRIAEVGGTDIYVFEALNFENPHEWSLILKDGGELLLESRHNGDISRDMLLAFKSGMLTQAPDDPDRCRIYSLTEQELLMRYRSVKLRWTPQTLEIVTAEYGPTREIWDFLYGPTGAVMELRLSQARQRDVERGQAPGRDPNRQLGQEYLMLLREYRHLNQWFSLLIARNLKVWGKVTCAFRNKTVIGSSLGVADFLPERENPENKEEAEAIKVYHEYTQPALDYYDANVTHIESELSLFVAKGGELPPAVEDGGIFGLHEVHTDVQKLKREGLKLFMRRSVREA